MLGGPQQALFACLIGGALRAGARWWSERLHELAPEEFDAGRRGSVGRTTLWRRRHPRRLDESTHAVPGEEEANAPVTPG